MVCVICVSPFGIHHFWYQILHGSPHTYPPGCNVAHGVPLGAMGHLASAQFLVLVVPHPRDAGCILQNVQGPASRKILLI